MNQMSKNIAYKQKMDITLCIMHIFYIVLYLIHIFRRIIEIFQALWLEKEKRTEPNHVLATKRTYENDLYQTELTFQMHLKLYFEQGHLFVDNVQNI